MAEAAGPSDATLAAQASGGVVLSETQLGNMALRAKQQRTKAEQDKELLAVRMQHRGAHARECAFFSLTRLLNLTLCPLLSFRRTASTG